MDKEMEITNENSEWKELEKWKEIQCSGWIAKSVIWALIPTFILVPNLHIVGPILQVFIC